jgi:hypothetical protein
MFGKEHYTREARGVAMVCAFKRAAVKCMIPLGDVDREIPRKDLLELHVQIRWLEDELRVVAEKVEDMFPGELKLYDGHQDRPGRHGPRRQYGLRS